MTKDQVVQALTQLGWTRDRWGHMQKSIKRINRENQTVVRDYRVKIQSISCRVEIKGELCGWIRFSGAYYRDIIIATDGRLKIGSHFFGKVSS